jgi:glycosyltransferase involved in cell wall biosynthesis
VVKALRKTSGIKHLIHAVSLIQRDNANVYLLIVGDGPLLKRLRQQAKKQLLHGSYCFVGAVNHNKVRLQLRQMDIFALPSLAESFGVSALEASACELPVVTTWAGGLPEVVKHDVTGYMVAPGCPYELATYLRFLIEDADKRRNMGKAGRAWVKERYEWSENMKALVALIKSKV